MSADEFADVPREMREADRWVLWKGADKEPYQVHHPKKKAKVSDPSTWASFDEAVAALPGSGCDGLGFNLGDGFTGIDLDVCRKRGDAATARAWARRIVELCASYTEISPSGVGAKVFMRGAAPAALDGVQIPMHGDPVQVNGRMKSPQVETYLGYNAADGAGKGRYFTVTGEKIHDAPSELRDGAAGWAHVEKIAAKKGKTRKGPAPPITADKLSSGRHKAMTSLAGSMRRRGATDREILAALRQFNVDRCEPTCPDDDVRQIAESVARYPVEEVDVTHDTLALAMGQAWPDARYVAAWAKWLFWRGSRWSEDEVLLHMTRCRAFLREAAEQLVTWAADRDEDDQKAASKSARDMRQAPTIARVVGLARSNTAQAAEIEQWDADRDMFGTPNEGSTK